MKANSLTVAFALCLMASASMAQTQYDQRLVAKYGQDQVAAMAAKSPDQVAWYTYWADHSFSLVNASEVAGQPITGTVSLSSLNPADINILTLPVKVMEQETTYYTVSGTTKVLVLRPRATVMQEYRDQQ